MPTPSLLNFIPIALALTLASPAWSHADEKSEPGVRAKASDVKYIKGAILEKSLNGVQVSVFKSDKEGNPTPNHVWIGALNHNKDAMIVTAVVQYSAEKAKNLVVNYESKVALVVGADAARLIWERDGDNIEILQIKDLEVK